MPIEAVVSSNPTTTLPEWLAELKERSWRIVPTSRRRRALIQESDGAAILSRIWTLDDLLKHLTGYATTLRPVMGHTGQLLRIARAWREAHPNKPTPTPGRVVQLDQISAEWRELGKLPSSGHPHGKFLRAYAKILDKDGCTDRPGWIEAIAKELADRNSPLARVIGQLKSILFDGFHRFNEAELRLVEAIGQYTSVRLWLVGDREQAFFFNVQSILERLKIEKPIDVRRIEQSSFSSLGQSLFVAAKLRGAELVELVEAPNAEEEVAAIARRIKQLHRSWSADTRLADIAVVVPDDAYVRLVRSTFAATGITCAPAAETFALSQSRPARLVLAAMRIVRHEWPADALFDFLRQPLVYRKLDPRYRLDHLESLSPRLSARRSWPDWQGAWRTAIERYERGAPGEDEKSEEDVEKRRSVAVELRKLLDSISAVLEPIRELQQELQKEFDGDSKKLVAAVVRLLNAVGIDKWLTPTDRRDWTEIPAREWEIDQLAFNNLKDVLTELSTTPTAGFDSELVLQLALAAEQFQASAADDAGVQIIKSGTIRGLTFRAVFAVGLVEGKVPPNPPEELPDEALDDARARRRVEDRREQEYLFTQLFESASESLVLSRPKREGDADLIESPFLRRVKEVIGWSEGKPLDNTIIDPAQALLHASRLDESQRALLTDSLSALDVWNRSRQADRELKIHDWALPLLNLRYPPEKAFSATALEKYASCPFQHFVTKTLGLEESQRDDSALRSGLFVHEVIEAFFHGWNKEHGEMEFDAERARPIFERLFAERWGTQGHALEPSLNHLFAKALTETLMSIGAYLVKEGYRQVAAEWEFKDVAITDEAGNSILLYGKIDRIDRKTTENGVIELIADFKTGRVRSGKELEHYLQTGRLLQLPLYGLARQLATKQEQNKVTHGLYVRLSRKVKAVTPSDYDKFLVHVGGELQLPSRAMPQVFSPEAAGTKAVELAMEMRSGRIPLTEYDIDHKHSACGSYCPTRHACRQPKGYG